MKALEWHNELNSVNWKLQGIQFSKFKQEYVMSYECYSNPVLLNLKTVVISEK